jgi:hypothetical protein
LGVTVNHPEKESMLYSLLHVYPSTLCALGTE